MKALRTFVRGGDESLQEAHTQLRRLIFKVSLNNRRSTIGTVY
jgi:hypothetical protein